MRPNRRSLSRRQLLSQAGAAASAATLAGIAPRLSFAPVAESRSIGGQGWEAVKAQFELTDGYLHFAAPVLASHPTSVRVAIDRHRKNLDRNTRVYLYANEVRYDESVIKSASDYIDAPTEEIALTDSTTMGLGTFYAGLSMQEGDEVLTTIHDFYATHEGLRFMAERSGARVRKVELYPEPSPNRATRERIVESIVEGLTSRTKAVALTWVHSSSGVKLPIAEIAMALRDKEARLGHQIALFVDGVHGLGVEDETIPELGCDALITGCHKWLFGPRGTGIVWARRDAWRMTTPTIPSFDGGAYGAWLSGRPPTGVAPGRIMSPGGFHSFEHRWALAEAFRFHQQIGRRAVAERTRALATQLKEGLAALPGVEVVTPMDPQLSSGIVCFAMQGVDPQFVVSTLEEKFRVIASVTPYRQPFIRFMPSIVNAPDEIEEALLALRTLRVG